METSQRSGSGLIGRLKARHEERRKRLMERAHREHQGDVVRGGRRQDGFKDKVPSPSDQYGGSGF